MLVAQCTGGGPCELTTGLPWYFGAIVAVVWLAVVVGALLLARRFLMARLASRRRESDDGRRSIEGPKPGTEVDPW